MCESYKQQMELLCEEEEDHVKVIKLIKELKRHHRCGEEIEIGQKWLQRKLVEEISKPDPNKSSYRSIRKYLAWLQENGAMPVISQEVVAEAESRAAALLQNAMTRSLTAGPKSDSRKPVFFISTPQESTANRAAMLLQKHPLYLQDGSETPCVIHSVAYQPIYETSEFDYLDKAKDMDKKAVKNTKKVLDKREHDCVIVVGFPQTPAQLVRWADNMSEKYKVQGLILVNPSHQNSDGVQNFSEKEFSKVTGLFEQRHALETVVDDVDDKALLSQLESKIETLSKK